MDGGVSVCGYGGEGGTFVGKEYRGSKECVMAKVDEHMYQIEKWWQKRKKG